MTSLQQIEEWAKGNPIHDSKKNQCCPDFSCCTGDIVEEKVRLRFKKAFVEKDHDTVNQMLMMFLGRAIRSNTNTRVYIAGDAERSVN